MKIVNFILLCLAVLLSMVKSSDRLEFLVETTCRYSGELCSSENPCCQSLTCSEFKVCRN